MKLVQKKLKQQYIKAYCLMYPWYRYEEHCEWVKAVTYTSPGHRNKPDGLKHGRYCLKWLREIDAMSMSGLTSISNILGDE